MEKSTLISRMQNRISFPLILGVFISFGVMVVALRSMPGTIGGLLAVLFFMLCAIGSIYVVKVQGIVKPRHFIIPLLVAAILLPPIRLPAGIPAIRFDLLIILFAWGLRLGSTASSGQPLILRHQHINKWFGIFGLAIICSMTYATLVKGFPILLRDAFELVKLLKYFLIFSFVASLKIPYKDFQRYCTVALVIFLLSAFFGFAQYLNLFNINASVSPYYAPRKIRGLLVLGRITGTTGNPNMFGALMVFAAVLAFALALFSEKKNTRIFSWLCVPVFCFAVILTLSRSSLIILCMAFSLLFIFRYPIKIRTFVRNIKQLTIILTVMVLVFGSLLFIAPEKFFSRIGRLASPSTDTSLQARFLMWDENIELWKGSMLFGWGPGKAVMSTVTDNEWLLFLRRYGIVGASVFILWFVNVYRDLKKISVKMHQMRQRDSFVALVSTLRAMLVSYAFYMIVLEFFHNLQLMPIVFLFLGLAYSKK